MTKKMKQQETKKLRTLLILVIPMTLVSFIGCKGDGGGEQAPSSIADIAPVIDDNLLEDIIENEDGDFNDVTEDVLDQITKVEEEEIRNEVEKEVEQAENNQKEDSDNNKDQQQEVTENDADESGEQDEPVEGDNELASVDKHKKAIKRLRGRRQRIKLHKLLAKARIQVRIQRIKTVRSKLQDLREDKKALHKLIKELRTKKKAMSKNGREAINKEIKDIRDLEIAPLKEKIAKKKNVKKRLKKKVKKIRKRVKKMNKKLKRLRKRIQRHKRIIASEG